MTLAQAESELAALKDGLEAPRPPGWDQKLLHRALKRYGSVENFIQVEVRRIEDVIRFHGVQLLDEE